MAYLGRQPIVGNYQVLDALTATTTDTYALTKNSVAVFPQTPANCIVSLNGVIQAPYDSYTISGSNIVFASALTASDSIDFITVLGDVLNVGTVSDGTIGLAKLSATGTKDATTFLRGDNTFATPAGGTNTPAFEATLSTNQTITQNTQTKAQFNTERFDTDSAYDSTTNYRFTVPSGKDGKYFIYSNILMQSAGQNRDVAVTHYIKKNGATAIYAVSGSETIPSLEIGSTICGVLDLVATDYVELNVYHYDFTAGGNCLLISGVAATFGGFKLI